ncbi:MAG TPA: hypothetical protein DCS07_00505 [Bdellovibrionales bacterium]|nr:MAG: hypothetical protein A2Z97_02485 [Bdellovibrionales bacterium GWB1_52_6]OFZ03510.1 MAG: hypothetical protein A2X97_06070 [Bdellovibrionales bacterium GWA1_52_35]OFZ37119.1 MAG: hypothetical protein A2070_04060 [Bdellovibrionales bacterium GWC1_52_8]HAR41111.1 hypothetical protein [Bdellovibrionales bacterium]HCM41096.1 hypothetical protein [Bdellovibrionales bacterium]
MEVIRLLKSKNRCLEQFLELSEEFLKTIETGNFSDLETFYKKRDRILKGFDLFDRKLTETLELLPKNSFDAELAAQVEQALNMKAALIGRIAATDQKIVDAIQEEKLRITKEMANSQKQTSTVKKFKSSWVGESGEDLDRKL